MPVELAECIVWKTGDAQALDVESNSFDVSCNQKCHMESAAAGPCIQRNGSVS